MKVASVDDAPSFLQWLGMTRHYECTDPRDRVYGLLGLPTSDADPDNGHLFLDPDYDLSVDQVYRMAARTIIEKSNNLNLLSAVQHGYELNVLGLSWIPDWNRAHVMILAPTDPRPTFEASGHNPRQPAINVDGDALIVNGIEFDVVASSTTIFSSGDFALLRGNSETDPVLPRELGESSLESEQREPGDPQIMEHYQAEPGIDRLSDPVTRKFEETKDIWPEHLTEEGITALAWTMTAGKDWYGSLVHDSDSHLADFRAFQHALGSASTTAGSADPVRAERFLEAASNACSGRRIFRTRKGFLGLGPAALSQGDLVAVLLGGRVPFVLRKFEDYEKLVGECYVFGIMQGEIFRDADDCDVRKFELR